MFYDDIYHYGIPGQRHGRRRFQNRDGSLTPAGRARYLKGRSSSGIYKGHGGAISGYLSPAAETKYSEHISNLFNSIGYKGHPTPASGMPGLSDAKLQNARNIVGAWPGGKIESNLVTNSASRIKRPSNSNKNGTTSGSTKQNRRLSKNTQERTRYLTERAAAMNAIDLNAKYTRRLFAGLDTEDIKTNGTANNARNRYLDGLDALATRLGLTTDDLVISNFPSYEASYNSSSKRR